MPERHAAALYAPPSHRRFWLQTAAFWEMLGRRFNPQFMAGALLVEVAKQVYARPPSEGSRVAVPGPLEVLGGLTRPAQARAGVGPWPPGTRGGGPAALEGGTKRR